MRGTVIHARGDVRFEHRDNPRMERPTDALIRILHLPLEQVADECRATDERHLIKALLKP